MSFIATAIVVGGVGSVVGGALAAKGAGQQADAATQSSQAAITEQKRQFDINQKNAQPWITAGTGAIQQLQYLLGIGVPPGQAVQATSQATGLSPEEIFRMSDSVGTGSVGRYGAINDGSFVGRTPRFPRQIPGQSPGQSTGAPAGLGEGDFGSLTKNFGAEDFQTDPGYQFRLSEGIKALERSAAARGTTLSGGTLKELAQYNQGFASNEYQNAFNRFNQNKATRFNQLATLAGVGQQQVNETGQQGMQTATNIGNLTVGGQTAAAAARASGYNAWGNAIGNAANMPLNWAMLSKMGTGGNGTPPFTGYPVPGYPGGPS